MFITWQREHLAEARAGEKPHWVADCDGAYKLVQPAPPPGPLSPWLIPSLVGMTAFFGVAMELSVRRQLELARNGLEGEAIVDSVTSRRGGRSEHHSARWSFIAADQKLYHGSSTISGIDAEVLQTGSRVVVYYDATNPSRNRIENALWAVEWDQPATA